MNIILTKEKKKDIVKERLSNNFVENYETFFSAKNDIQKYILDEFKININIKYDDYCTRLLNESLKLIDTDRQFANVSSFIAVSMFNVIQSYLPNDEEIIKKHNSNYKLTELLLITDSLKNKKE